MKGDLVVHDQYLSLHQSFILVPSVVNLGQDQALCQDGRMSARRTREENKVPFCSATPQKHAALCGIDVLC